MSVTEMQDSLCAMRDETGCLFAKVFANGKLHGVPFSKGLHVLKKNDGDFSADQVLEFDSEIDHSIAERYAIHVLFPNINSPVNVAHLLAALCRHSSQWYCVNLIPERKNVVYVGLRRILSGDYVSLVMGQAPNAHLRLMPSTRHAPFTAMTFHIGGQGDAVFKAIGKRVQTFETYDGKERLQVGLADMPTGHYKNKTAFKKSWDETKSTIKALKSTLHPGVVSKLHEITFVLPDNCRSILTPHFKEVALRKNYAK